MTKIGYQSHKQHIADYVNMPQRTRQELIGAYLVLGQLERNAWIFAPRQDPPWVVPGTENYVRPINTDNSEISLLFFSRGPLAEEAYKIASDLGSGVATIDLVLSTGLFESLDLVSNNAKFQRALLPETTGILYDLYGSDLNLALSRNAILAIKVREKLLGFGIDIAEGLEIDPNAPPTKWDIERAILRAMANNFEDQKTIMKMFAPRPAGDILLGACDDTWCDMAGDLWKLRISISSAECEVNLPLADCRVAAKPVIASALPTSAMPRIDERIVGTFMQGAAPYRPNRARLMKQGGRWEYVGGLDLQ